MLQKVLQMNMGNEREKEAKEGEKLEIEKFMVTTKRLILVLYFNIVIIKLSFCTNPLNSQLIRGLSSTKFPLVLSRLFSSRPITSSYTPELSLAANLLL